MKKKDETLKGISYITEVIRNRGEKVRFNIGQSICDSGYLPGYIFLIESGTARLIDTEGSQLTTIKKLGKESIIGLSSILRGLSCENARASTELIAWRIDDLKLKLIYEKDEKFHKACNKYLGEIDLETPPPGTYKNPLITEYLKN